MANTPKSNTDKRGAPGKPKSEAHRAAISQSKIQHGLRAELRVGKLPAKLQYVEHRINAFRRKLEEAVVYVKKEVCITDSAAINSACKWERHGLLAQHWLRHEADKLSAGDRLKFSAEIAKASDQRDKNIRLLGLDAQRSMWDVIDGTVKDAS
jgi:hypothetical protein